MLVFSTNNQNVTLTSQLRRTIAMVWSHVMSAVFSH